MPKTTPILLVLAVLLTGCAGSQTIPTRDTTATSASAVTEEYTVYDLVIRALYLTEDVERIVIKDHAVTGAYPSESLEDNLKHVQEKLGAALSSDTLDDYKDKNGQTQRLDGSFSLDVPYVLLSEVEFNEIFETGAGWSQFYAAYPNSQGLMTLSRVGFNANMDQALVYVGNETGFLAGTGLYALLTKDGDVWSVQDSVVVWIS